ncbi:helix-turn-helix domain-containing protein [Pseudomonas aeruginosa]|uniref:helix-turn-helix domain-containing protein n=1 Tax=Pseudomonas aeruginosa TaxID=287 RepID=UPI000F7F2A59|nr:helix-turn-helix transcriptional regulator [Pseudomonas aeruginosa]RTB44127.1 XRE family transcriptional regulator [Pseudomonas aeruginosa]
MSELGPIIRASRWKNRWTQEELGERMYVTKAAVSSWECGRYVPPTNKLFRLSKLLGIPLEVLCDPKHYESLPDVSTWASEEDVLIYLYRRLPSAYQNVVLTLLHALQTQHASS